jgi:hypothetical protein
VAVHLLHRRVEAQVQAIAEPGEQGADVFPEPPGTTYHCGRSRISSRPWFSKKRKNSGSGKRRISCSDDDQMAAPIGRI